MPCYRCGKRAADPALGESPWRRGVRANKQVLVCPDCQEEHDWASGLDRCALCTSAALVRRLGEVECRDCGAVDQVTPASLAGDADSGDGISASLAAEVEQALAKVLGPARTRPPYAMS